MPKTKIIIDDSISYKGKTIGVRLDAIDSHILQQVVDKLFARPVDIFRLALSHYAQSLGIETNRATIADQLRKDRQAEE